jgi:hypothetical protein
MPQKRSRDAEQLALTMTQVQILDQDIERMGFIVALLTRVGIEAHATREKICVLWQADEA